MGGVAAGDHVDPDVEVEGDEGPADPLEVGEAEGSGELAQSLERLQLGLGRLVEANSQRSVGAELVQPGAEGSFVDLPGGRSERQPLSVPPRRAGPPGEAFQGAGAQWPGAPVPRHGSARGGSKNTSSGSPLTAPNDIWTQRSAPASGSGRRSAANHPTSSGSNGCGSSRPPTARRWNS